MSDFVLANGDHHEQPSATSSVIVIIAGFSVLSEFSVVQIIVSRLDLVAGIRGNVGRRIDHEKG